MDILSETWPNIFPLVILSEPIHMKNSGRVLCIFPHLNPMLKIVSHVVAAKWEHRKRIVTELADLSLCCCSHLGGHRSTEQNAVIPAERFDNEWNQLGAPAAKYNR